MNFTIPYSDRPMHVYVPGKTRFGKSTLIHHLALNDIQQGHGVCVMDGKGDFIPNFIRYIPEERAEDTIYLDIDTPIPLDFMGFAGEREKEALIGELKYLLMHTVEPQYAPLMTANITDLLYTLFNYNENEKTPPECRATFLDLYYFLADPKRRAQILSRVTDEALLQRWKDNFPNPVEASRITTRMTPYVRSETLRKIFGAKNPTLNIGDLIAERKVLLVNLGPPNDIRRTYGVLLLSKIRQAVYRRANAQTSYPPYYLFCDEFQEFQTSDFDKMLSMAGGLGLCLTLANQYVDQLESHILHAIKGNVSTFIAFRLGQESANALKSEFPKTITAPLNENQRRRAELERDFQNLSAQYTRQLEPIQHLAAIATANEYDHQWALNPANKRVADQLERLANEQRAIPNDPLQLIPIVDFFSRLQIGEILYRAADGTTSFLSTEKIPPLPPADYAEIIRKRTVDKYGCDSAQVCLDKADDHRPPPSDEIQATGPTVPPHHGQKKNPGPPR